MIIDGLVEDHLLHNQIVHEVAANRFGLDGWEISTNLALSTGDIIQSISPDIIATHSDEVVAVGEIETIGTICENRAKQWKEFGDSCVRFYLYVPKGAESEAVRLIAEHDVHCAGIRTYCFNDELDLKPVYIDTPISRDDDHPWWASIGGCDSNRELV